MKKYVIPAVALGMFSGLASAQSSVTLYGIVDLGLNYVSNSAGHRLYAMSSGVNNGSRFGLRGSEDLGAGLKAIFTLENGFDASNGKGVQGGLMFGRQAFVGLSSSRWGTVTLGRQYDSLVDFIGPFELGTNGGGNVSAHPGDLDNLNNNFRVNNAIKYKSPTFNGFTVGGVYSLGGVSGDVSRNQIYSLGASYSYGPFALAAAYMNARNPNVSYFGNSSQTTLTAATANTSSPVYSGFLSARTYQNMGAAASYRLGKTTFAASYTNIKFKDLGDTSSGPNPYGYSGDVTFHNAEVNVRYQWTPSVLVGLAYDFTKSGSVNANGGAKYHQVAADVTYSFSKRTVVYILGAYQHASGTNSLGNQAVASINLQSPSTSNNQSFVRVGLRHRF